MIYAYYTHTHNYIHTYIYIHTHIYTLDGNQRQPQHKHTKAEPRRPCYNWLASEYCERSQPIRTRSSKPNLHASLPRPPKIPDPGIRIVSMVNYMQVLRS